LNFSNFTKHINEHINVLENLNNELFLELDKVIDHLANAIENRHNIFWCGNGGSCSDAQHLAAELVGRFENSRKALPSIALSADTSVITCIANDYGYENIYSRQIEGLGKEGDIIFVISTSGQSKNILKVLEVANQLKLVTVGLLGTSKSDATSKCRFSLNIESSSTARIQETHILLGHIICDEVEKRLKLK